MTPGSPSFDAANDAALDGIAPFEPQLQSAGGLTDTACGVLDLPQLYAQPSAKLLLSVLADLSIGPRSWDATQQSVSSRTSHQRIVRSEGIPRYLTGIISSSLAWLDSDDQKEAIWELASRRMSERSGRSAMGALTRTFSIPLPFEPIPEGGQEDALGSLSHRVSKAAITITLHEPALTADNLGLKTWASSFLLAKGLCILRASLPALAPGEIILELGAGTGLVGIAAAAVLRTHVILTDLPDIFENLDKNARANSEAIAGHGGSVSAAILDWTIPEKLYVDKENVSSGSFPIILAADTIYSAEHPRLVVQAITHHLRRSSNAKVVIEVPLREGFAAERQGLRDLMCSSGLEIASEGEETGYDDWTSGEDAENPAEVVCWWSVWRWSRP